jgi:hypothetical protein
MGFVFKPKEAAMIEGVGTVANSNQGHAQTVQGQAETPVELTPDAAQGKVNAVEEFEDLSKDSNPDKGDDSQKKPQPQDDGEQIINLLG